MGKSKAWRSDTNTEKVKKAAIYCRVSVFDKTKTAFSSVEEQERLLREYCNKKNWEVYDVYVDENKSGWTTDRPNFDKLLSAAKKHEFDVLVAHKIDRVSRRNKDWWKLIDKFDRLGIDIVTIDPEIDTTTPFGRLIRSILISFAELEREMGRERTFTKMYAMARKGLWLGGMPPPGYKLVNKELIIDNKQAPIIKEIYNLYLKNYPPSEISRNLNSQGLRTPINQTKTGKICGNKKFNTNTILTYLKNPAYGGFVKFNNELFDGKHNALIPKKDWETVQASFNKVKESPRLGTGDNLLLTGILKCGKCNSYMTTSESLKTLKDGSKRKYYYYRCTKKTKFGADECNNRQISAKSIENYVINYISKVLSYS